MKTLKKIIALVCAAAMVCALAACGEKTQPATDTPNNSTGTSVTDTATSDTAVSGDIKYTVDGKLTMGTNAEFPPYEYHEGGDIVGIDAEIAALIAQKLGVELEIKDMEFDSIIGAVQTGSIDIGMAGMSVTEDRLKTVDFTNNYTTAAQVIIVKDDSIVASIDDLKDKKVGVQESTTGDMSVTEDLGEDHVKRYNKGSDAVSALKSGAVDAVVIDGEPAKSYVAANEGLKILETNYATEEYAIAVNKDNAALTEAINKALTELEADGSIEKIINKYIPAE